ncbi:MAG: hypothetical protein RB191_18535 [Terriglobia bacterium]|nr:hypothetical protein [Terriglobia bacterium]
MGAHQLQPNRAIQDAVSELESLAGGDRAVERILMFGRQAIPYLEHFLLDRPPRTISIPRCRAVRALGELGAYPVLFKYFERYEHPADSAVLFAEDAVRSAAAQELTHIRSEEVYRILLDAAKRRATSGLVRALGEFRCSESVPLLFELLEDDLCRADAMAELRKIPDAAQPYVILLLRGCTETPIYGSSASRRRRAALQLLSEFGISEREWPEIQPYLESDDLNCVIAAAQLGFSVVPKADEEGIVEALIKASARMNWAQEMEAIELLDQHRAVAQTIAMDYLAMRRYQHEKPSWLSPFWRILHHFLGNELLQHER